MKGSLLILSCLSAFVFALLLAGCGGKKNITDEDLAKVKQDMSYQQVSGILGAGTEMKAMDSTKSYTYAINGIDYTATFAGDRMISFESKSGAASDPTIMMKLKPEMSKADIDKALGVTGVEVKINKTSYEWKNEDGSVVQASFENDKLLGIGMVSAAQPKTDKK